MDYTTLQGLPFDEHKQNCYSLVRQFYKLLFDIELRDYANPHAWWSAGQNLFMDNFRAEGFQLLDCSPRDLQFGDVLLMAISAPVANHAAIIVDNHRILHHLVGQRSCVTNYGGLFRNTTVAMLRHPHVVLPEQTLDFASYLPVHVTRKLEELKTTQQSSSQEADPGA